MTNPYHEILPLRKIYPVIVVPTMAQRIRIFFERSIVVRQEFLLDGARRKDPIYIVRCDRCRTYFEDYPHGWDSYLTCPKCSAHSGGLNHL